MDLYPFVCRYEREINKIPLVYNNTREPGVLQICLKILRMMYKNVMNDAFYRWMNHMIIT